MTKKTLKFNNIRVNKKKSHMAKEPIDLMSVNIDQIVVSDKFNNNNNDKNDDDDDDDNNNNNNNNNNDNNNDNNNSSRYFIGYQKGGIVKPLCIILAQMSGFIKYVEYGGMNMFFLIKDDNEVQEKYKQIWDLIKNKLGSKNN